MARRDRTDPAREVSNMAPRPVGRYHRAMRAAILAVGTELLSTDRIDTHSLWLAEPLERHGVHLVRKAVVADEESEIAAEIASALERAELVLVTGGLGPTADDVTREGCARALGLRLACGVWQPRSCCSACPLPLRTRRTPTRSGPATC